MSEHVMSEHRITLVSREAVAGMNRIERLHQRYARDLRENGSRCDACRFVVTFNYCLLGNC